MLLRLSGKAQRALSTCHVSTPRANHLHTWQVIVFKTFIRTTRFLEHSTGLKPHDVCKAIRQETSQMSPQCGRVSNSSTLYTHALGAEAALESTRAHGAGRCCRRMAGAASARGDAKERPPRTTGPPTAAPDSVEQELRL